MNNTTLLLLLQQNTKLELTNYYDSIGAIIFIVVVLLWYSLSIVILLAMQTIVPAEIVEDSLKHSTKLFHHSFREKTDNKKILEELGDKEKRDKLWDIYLGTSGDMNDRNTRAETLRIRNIQQKLITINENYRDDNERVQYFNDDNSFHLYLGSSVPDISSVDRRLRVRRQSSLDQQIIEEWKATLDGLKIHESWPWVIQRFLIRRHIQRQQQIKNKHFRPVRKQSIP